MKTWFVTLEFGIVGCTPQCDLLRAETREEAEKEAYDMCVEHAQSYGFEQDKEVFGDLDTVGRDYDEDLEEYSETGFIDSSVELYDPEKHDEYL